MKHGDGCYHVGDLGESDSEFDDDRLRGVEDGSWSWVIIIQQMAYQSLLVRYRRPTRRLHTWRTNEHITLIHRLFAAAMHL